MLTYEYRIPMPMHLADYERAHLYATMEVSKELTGGGHGIEIIANTPFEGTSDQINSPEYVFANGPYEKGQYTEKIMFVANIMPAMIRKLAPKGSLEVKEKSHNSFPYCSTVLSNPDYMKDGFYIIVETVNVAGDRGGTSNIFNLNSDLLAKRTVVTLDIANNVDPGDYTEHEDPTIYTSTTTDQAPLTKGWIKSATPVMCSYKRVTIKFKWFGIGDAMEKRTNKKVQKALIKVHRCLFCTTDKWHEMTMADIRVMEDKTKTELNKLRVEASLPAAMATPVM